MATATRGHASANLASEQLPIVATPDQLDWLVPSDVAEPPIHGSNGDPLRQVAFSYELLDWYRDGKVLQKQMLESTEVSPITGCWLPTPERYRAHGGYVPAGDKSAAVSPSGSTSRHRAVWQRIYVPNGHDALTPDDTWEHYCRTPGCSNPAHGVMMSLEENNQRKNEARDFEHKLWANQPFLSLAGIEWLEPLVNEAGEGLVDTVVSTRYGAYLLSIEDGIMFGHHLPDPVREAMRKPAPYPHQKEKVEVHACQLSLDPQEMYADLMRRAIERRKASYQTPLAA